MTAAAETRLPRQVRERIERGRQLMAELDAPKGAEAIEEPTPPNGDEATTPPAATETAPPPAPPADRTDPPPFHDPSDDKRFEDPKYWQQRFSVLQGVMRKDRADADAREAALQKKVAELENQLRAMQASAPAQVDLSAFLSPEQIEALGEDQAKAIVAATVKAARQNVEDALSKYQSDAEATRQAEQERQVQQARRRFHDALDELMPNWREIDERQDWLLWLGEIDPKTGQQRQEDLNGHIRAGDAVKAASLMAAFMQSLSPRPQPPVAPPRQAGTPPAAPPSNERDLSLVPPSKEEIADFYKRRAVNGGRGVSEQERAAFEARLRLL